MVYIVSEREILCWESQEHQFLSYQLSNTQRRNITFPQENNNSIMQRRDASSSHMVMNRMVDVVVVVNALAFNQQECVKWNAIETDFTCKTQTHLARRAPLLLLSQQQPALHIHIFDFGGPLGYSALYWCVTHRHRHRHTQNYTLVQHQHGRLNPRVSSRILVVVCCLDSVSRSVVLFVRSVVIGSPEFAALRRAPTVTHTQTHRVRVSAITQTFGLPENKNCTQRQ